MFAAFTSLLRRDLLIAYRNRSELVMPLLFFLLVVTLFPLGVSPEPKLLSQIAPGVVLVAALLAMLLGLDGLFRSDFDDGALEQMALSPHPLALFVAAKVCAHWLLTGLPLALVSPLLALLLAMPLRAVPILMVTLLLATPILSLVGAIGVALTVGLKRGGALLSLLVLPLYVPALIFAASAVVKASGGVPIGGELYMLGALAVLAASLAPMAAAAALRVSLD